MTRSEMLLETAGEIARRKQDLLFSEAMAHGGHVKLRNLQNLLNRAAAALETPKDLTPKERVELIEDLTAMDLATATLKLAAIEARKPF